MDFKGFMASQVQEAIDFAKNLHPEDFPLRLYVSGEYPDSEEEWGVGWMFDESYSAKDKVELINLIVGEVSENQYVRNFSIYGEK